MSFQVKVLHNKYSYDIHLSFHCFVERKLPEGHGMWWHDIGSSWGTCWPRKPPLTAEQCTGTWHWWNQSLRVMMPELGKVGSVYWKKFVILWLWPENGQRPKWTKTHEQRSNVGKFDDISSGQRKKSARRSDTSVYIPGIPRDHRLFSTFWVSSWV